MRSPPWGSVKPLEAQTETYFRPVRWRYMKGSAYHLRPSNSFPDIITLLCPSLIEASQHRSPNPMLKMLSKILCSVLLPATVLVAHARIIPRDGLYVTTRPGEIIFPNDKPICANDENLNIFGTAAGVTVKNDCDLAISTVCTKAVADFKKGRETESNMVNTKATAGAGTNPCEAIILFSQPKLRYEYTYDECVAGFQSITVECMVQGQGEGSWSPGVIGEQAGVRNVIYTTDGKGYNSTYPMIKANNIYDTTPGYLVGPPNFFSQVPGKPGTFYDLGVDASGTYGKK
ncbi:MAG: hypothetical protein Q9173_001224 [Seirophora scorigena]